MEFGLKVAFCLLLVSGTVTVRGSDASDGHGLSVFDSLRGKGSPSSTKPPARDGAGLNLEDALNPKPAKPAGGDDSRFNLEDALRPAVKPTDKPTGGECQAALVQKLGTVIENQRQQIRLLLQLVARSPSATSRFMMR
ncbi:hypothetical protein INR49_002748 [Caranx melampygus]|nr:hypothetical protein INR49_002748 [Caranx melampygus]